jgi:DNA polymerase III subunit alpha
METHICITPSCNHSSHYKPMVNYHMHSGFSQLDGAGKFEDYCKLAKEYNIPGLALTDHGTAVGIYSFYKTVKDAGLKPVLGEEFYLTTDLALRKPNRERDVYTRDKHQTILIADKDGYKNFCKLNYLSYTEGYYYKPRIDYEMLFHHHKGLLVTSGCAASMFNQLNIQGKEKEAEEWFVRFVKTFGENFVGEIQFNELNDKGKYGMDQKFMNDFIIRMCRKYDIKIVIGGDTHYAYEEDAKLQDILINCQRRKDGAAVEMSESFIHARHLYFHNSNHYHQFNKMFDYGYDSKFIDECLENSVRLLDKINFEFEVGKINYPKYTVPESNLSNLAYTDKIAFQGLLHKLEERKQAGEEFTSEQIDAYEQRLNHELEVIDGKGYIDYFLVFQDVARWAKANGVYCGPARGSAGGSLLSYALDITEIDPVKFGLYFERFLNAERNSPPDIDWDVANGAREKIREYLENKYGKDSVFGVVTYGLYHPKSALQDSSRGLGKDTSFESTLMREVSKIHNLDEQTDLVNYFNELQKTDACTPTLYQWIKDNQDTIYWAQKMLGQCKNLGTHAGGIVITPGPVYDHIPVARGGKEIVTAFRESDGSGKDLSELGLLKLDILGLKTLNVINDSINDIKKDLGVDITKDIKYINLFDPKLYEKFRKGNNVGIFQFESATIDGLIKSIEPDCFEDMVAINAINRPGPLENFAPVFGKWKRWEKEGNTKELVEIESQRYPFEFMKGPLSETYGCLLYQEQFMLMVKEAAGFNMGEADSFRRAIGWQPSHPKYHTVKKYFDKLETSMLAKGYTKQDVDKFLDYCRGFMGYSYNKSHALAYAYLAMQTLYLKVYYPAYFYANLLNTETHENYQAIIADATANGVKILRPSINKSKYRFTVEGDTVRIGLKALKGFGDTAYEELETLNVHQYETIYEILSLPFRKVNSKAFQCLIDVGAFDEFGVEREKIETIRELFKETKSVTKYDEKKEKEVTTDARIAKWFTRKRKALEIDTMPECLLQFPENIVMSLALKVKEEEQPAQKLVAELIPYVKVKKLSEEKWNEKEESVLGFSLAMVEKLGQLLTLGERYPDLNLQSLTSRQNDTDLCYWFLMKKTTAKTKKGKEYLVLDISDNNMTIKAKCWDMVDVKKGCAYVSNIKKDDWGYTVVVNNLLTEVEL